MYAQKGENHMNQTGKKEPTIVTVPVDITEIESKIIFHLSARQLLWFGAGLALGLPAYFLVQRYLENNSMAVFAMMLVMMPCFMMAIYRKNGKTLDQKVKSIVEFYLNRAQIRPYRTKLRRQEVKKVVRKSNKKQSSNKANTAKR